MILYRVPLKNKSIEEFLVGHLSLQCLVHSNLVRWLLEEGHSYDLGIRGDDNYYIKGQMNSFVIKKLEVFMHF